MGKKKSQSLAAIASFFIPGLGQIYTGEVRKGIFFIIFSVFIFSILIFLFFEHPMTLPLLAAGAAFILFWINNIYDAYKTARIINFQK